jgi:hypothetical protein
VELIVDPNQCKDKSNYYVVVDDVVCAAAILKPNSEVDQE